MTDVAQAFRVIGVAFLETNYPVIMLAFAVFSGTIVALKGARAV